MKGKSIAIISRRIEFARFFELEVSRYGFKALVGSDATDAYGCCALILDAESENALPKINVPLLMVSSKFAAALTASDCSQKVYQLLWPCPVTEFSRFLVMIQNGEFGVVDREAIGFNIGGQENTFSFSFLKGERAVQLLQDKIFLTDTEYKLLRTLYEAGGTVVTRTDLDKLLDCEGNNMTDVYVCHLRNKLEKPFSVRLIHTVRGKGYCLDEKIFS